VVDSADTTGRSRRTNEYRIEKDRHPVTLTLLGGEAIIGAMFVQGHARHRSAREDPGDILNEPEPFFPLVTESGETLLIPKARVLEVFGDIPSQRLAPRGTGGPGVTIAVTLVGGMVRTGAVFLDMPGPAPRPLDFLNHLHDRFFALHETDGVRLINRDLIDRVHPLD
jgi:hypothetical protein